MRKLRQLLATALTVMLVISCFTAVAASPLSLPALISDNMLIQRDKPVKLWGYGGTPGAELIVEFENEKGVAVNKGSTTITDNGFNIELPAMKAGGPYTIRFLDTDGNKLFSVYNVLVGELWFQGGQSNMAYTIKQIPNSVEERVNPNPKDDTIRLFYDARHADSKEPATDLEGQWIVADKNTVEYSAVGYRALEIINNELGIPVGGICSTYGGSSIDAHVAPDGGVYKAKIAPATQFNIGGIMWYQGESDKAAGIDWVENAYNNLISSLRAVWNDTELPFIMTQLHPSPMKGLVYGSETEWEVKDWSDVRVGIGNAHISNDNTAMVVIQDLSTTKYRADGEDPVHAWIKEPAGERMGNAALALAYGKNIQAYSPVYKGISIDGNKVVLTFKDTYEGLRTTDGSDAKGFMIAGEDGVYHEATATLEGNKVVLTSDKVASPVNASYGIEKHYFSYPGGFKDIESVNALPDVCALNINVVNSAGLPVGAFDTATSITEKKAEATENTDTTKVIPEVKVEEIATSGDKTVLYVAKDGKDTNSGSINSPFATLAKARDTIRALKAENKLGAGGAVVYVREGEYYMTQGLTLTEEDSGTEDAPIVYRNYPGEEVTFTGAAIIDSGKFKKVTDNSVLSRIVDEDARNKIIAVDMFALGYTELPEQTLPGAYSYGTGVSQVHGLPAPTAAASELVIDGKSMTLARYPNEGWMYIDSVIEPGSNLRYWYDDKEGLAEYVPPDKRIPVPFTVTVDDDRVDNWTKATDALLTGAFCYAWATQTVPLASVNPEKNAITSKYPSEYSVALDQYFYIYNLIEEIDAPGEYFIDREKGMLYIYPPEGGMNEILYTTFDQYAFTLNKVKNVTIKGIDIIYTRSGAVLMTDTNNCSVIGCDIHFTGKTAIDIIGSENKVLDCKISDVEMGVKVQGGDTTTLTHAKNIVANNDIERADRLTKDYSAGIAFYGVGNYILNNKVHDADHLVLQFSGEEHVIAYNEIYDACKHADDMGAIYCGRKLTDRGNMIIHNYFHDIGGADLGTQGTHGVFLDDWFSWVLIQGNVFENITGAGAMFSGSHNKLINNVFVNVGLTAGRINRSYNYGNTDSGYDIAFRNEIEKASSYIFSDIWLEKYPEIVNIIDENGRFDINNNIVAKNNVLFNTPEITTSTDVQRTAIVENNLTYASDPGFYDLTNRNYLLKPDSSIYENIPDFKPILFTRMGNYSERAINRVKNAYVMSAESPFVIKNGEIVKGEINGATVIDGTIYLPVRIGAEAVNSALTFDEATNNISISSGAKVVTFTDGAKDKVFLNGAEYPLAKPIVNVNYTNYISAEDLVKLFESNITQHGTTIVISDTKDLFIDEIDEDLLRYLTDQISIY